MRDAPCATVAPSRVQEFGDCTEHDKYVYDPLKLPSLQLLVCETAEQSAGDCTEEAEKNVDDWPWVRVFPSRVQEEGGVGEQVAYW